MCFLSNTFPNAPAHPTLYFLIGPLVESRGNIDRLIIAAFFVFLTKSKFLHFENNSLAVWK